MADLRIVKASNISPEPITWLWRDRIPLGKLTLLAGEGGLGKSTLTVALAAKLSHGALEGQCAGHAAASLILSTEDDASDTITPRLMAAGANLDLVHVQAEQSDGLYRPITLPEDQETLAETVKALGVRFLVFDPLGAFLSERIDSFKDQSVRRVLGPVSAFAARYEVAVVGIMHLNRRESSEASSRISGSSGFRNAARSVLVFGADPNAPEDDVSRRVIAQEKANLCRPGLESVAAHLASATVEVDGRQLETSRLVLDGFSPVMSRDLLATRAAPDEAQTDAEMFLLDTLADGPKKSRDVHVEGRQQFGLTPKQLRTAATRLGVKKKRGAREESGCYWWTLPSPPDALPEGWE